MLHLQPIEIQRRMAAMNAAVVVAIAAVVVVVGVLSAVKVPEKQTQQ